MCDDNLRIEHHKQFELCTSRPAYRQGRNLTAVKVYTISSESQHLFIYGVPSINLRSELKSLCNKYGNVINIHVVLGQENEPFTECYHVHFERLQSARIAKRLIDNKSFYGGVLHVCYAPEHESLAETRNKLSLRNKEVLQRLNSGKELIQTTKFLENNDYSHVVKMTKSQIKKKRKLAEIGDSDDPVLKHLKKFDDLLEGIEVDQTIKNDAEPSGLVLPGQVQRKKPQNKKIVLRKNVQQLV